MAILNDEQMLAKTPPAPGVTNAQASTYQSQNASSTGYTSQRGEAERAEATLRDVGTNETVQGQIAGIIDYNSPLMRRAVQRANEQMAGRGLINSSIAVGAGQAALYDAALPIAQQDASTYAQTARDNNMVTNDMAQFNAGQANQMTQMNITEANKASQFTAGAQNTAALQNAQAANQARDTAARLQTQVSQSNAEARNKAALAQFDGALNVTLQNADSATRTFIAQMGEQTKLELANIEAQFKNQMQVNASAAELYSQVVNNITSLTQNPDLPPDAKADAVNQQTAMLQNGLTLFNAATNDPEINRIIDSMIPAEVPQGPASTSQPGMAPPAKTTIQKPTYWLPGMPTPAPGDLNWQSWYLQTSGDSNA